MAAEMVTAAPLLLLLLFGLMPAEGLPGRGFVFREDGPEFEEVLVPEAGGKLEGGGVF